MALAMSGLLRHWVAPGPGPSRTPLRSDLQGALLPHAEVARAAGHALSGEFVVGPEGRVLLGVEGNVYDAASGAPVFSTQLPGLTSFAQVPEGPFLAVQGAVLGYPQAGGLARARELPCEGLRVVAWGRRRAVLFGGDEASGALILACDRRGRLRELLRVGQPVTALAPAGEDLYFASEGQVYLLREDRRVEAVAALAGAEPVRALCFDPDSLVLYVLRGERLLALVDHEIRELGSGLADALRVHAGRLYLLDVDRTRLIHVTSPPWKQGKGGA